MLGQVRSKNVNERINNRTAKLFIARTWQTCVDFADAAAFAKMPSLVRAVFTELFRLRVCPIEREGCTNASVAPSVLRQCVSAAAAIVSAGGTRRRFPPIIAAENRRYNSIPV